MHGIGWIVLNHNTKTIYRGNFKDGEKSGFGIEYDEFDDLIFLGMWEHNRKKGIGIEL